jgi:hypothetical protein
MSNISSNQDAVSRLASQADAIGRLAQDTGGFSAKVVAMLPKSPKLLVEKKSVAGGSTK